MSTVSNIISTPSNSTLEDNTRLSELGGNENGTAEHQRH